MRWEEMLSGGGGRTAFEASFTAEWPAELEDAFRRRDHRDHSNERGPQPQVIRVRAPWVTDYAFTDGGPARAKCQHGKVWPEGDYLEPRGRACRECLLDPEQIERWQRFLAWREGR